MRTYSIIRHRWYTRSEKANPNCLDCKKPLTHPYRGNKRCRKCDAIFKTIPPEIRFWKYVKKTKNCWIWIGAKQNGKWKYGIFDKDKAHRFSWKIHYGKIEKGMFICHKCDNPPCIRPDHLFKGTPADNMADKVAKGRQIPVKNTHAKEAVIAAKGPTEPIP